VNRNLRGRLLLTLTATVLALGFGEIAARLILPHLRTPQGTAWIRDPECGFRLRPSAPGEFPQNDDRHINRDGFRDRDHPPVKPAGVRRILGVGDSFVYGAVPLADNFLRISERLLNAAAPDDSTEVLLLGAPGYSPENEAALLENFGLGLDPDLVVLNIFVGNDISGIPVRGEVIAGRMYFPHSPIGWLNLLRKSRLFQMTESMVYRRLKDRVRGDEARAVSDTTLCDDLYLAMVGHNLPVYRSLPSPQLEKLWDETTGYLDRMVIDCHRAGVPLLVVLIPAEEQVDPRVRDRILAGLSLEPEDYDFDLPQRRLRAWAADREVKVLDLLPVMRREHRPAARLYLPCDTHWNARGNALAARELAAACELPGPAAH